MNYHNSNILDVVLISRNRKLNLIFNEYGIHICEDAVVPVIQIDCAVVDEAKLFHV